ncbi:MAG: hypothetical protein EA344_13425 [Alkalicoccus sp.]|uniref:Uncharacterized protein n=1 Tax=Alkalicoccus sp. TaxID=2005376 RepID=A0A651DSG0_9BACI|nr:MAG: hypothetical protein EA344_13425 [Alkalicoccus sp.]
MKTAFYIVGFFIPASSFKGRCLFTESCRRHGGTPARPESLSMETKVNVPLYFQSSQEEIPCCNCGINYKS